MRPFYRTHKLFTKTGLPPTARPTLFLTPRRRSHFSLSDSSASSEDENRRGGETVGAGGRVGGRMKFAQPIMRDRYTSSVERGIMSAGALIMCYRIPQFSGDIKAGATESIG